MRNLTSLQRYALIFLACLACRLLVIGLLFSAGFDPAQGGDMLFYQRWALKILGGNWSDGGAFYGLPGYPALLAGLYALTGPIPLLATVIQAFSEAAIACLIYAISHKWVFRNESDAPALLAAAGWILFQPAATFSAVLMPTSFAALLFWSAVAIAFWEGNRKSSKSIFLWFGLGVGLGLGATIVATVLFLVPWLVARALFAPGSRRNAILCCMFLGAGVLAGTAPCWGYNRFIAKEPVGLSAHSGINFYLGNNPLANGYPRIPPGMRAGQEGMLKDSITVAEAEVGHPLKRYEVSQHWAEKAKAYIKNNPGPWLKLMARKVWNFWDAWEYDDLSLIPLFRREGILLPGIRFGLAATLGLVGVALTIRKNREARWVFAAVLCHMAALLPVFITERYRMMAVPGLLIFAGFTVAEFYRGFVRAKFARSLAISGTAAALALVFATPPADVRLWSLAPYNLGVQLLNAGRGEEALPLLERAWRYVPENAELNFAIGNYWFERDPSRAEQFYARTLRLAPEHAGAWKNLGVIAVQQKHWKDARELLEHAAELNDTAQTQYLLAIACDGLQDRQAAAGHALEATRRDPSKAEYRAYAEQLQAPLP